MFNQSHGIKRSQNRIEAYKNKRRNFHCDDFEIEATQVFENDLLLAAVRIAGYMVPLVVCLESVQNNTSPINLDDFDNNDLSCDVYLMKLKKINDIFTYAYTKHKITVSSMCCARLNVNVEDHKVFVLEKDICTTWESLICDVPKDQLVIVSSDYKRLAPETCDQLSLETTKTEKNTLKMANKCIKNAKKTKNRKESRLNTRNTIVPCLRCNKYIQACHAVSHNTSHAIEKGNV